VKADLSPGRDVGEFGPLLQEQDQAGALEQVRLGGPAAGQQPNLDEEVSGEAGLVERGGAGQEICPLEIGRVNPMNRLPSP
jgi:hypothetical protein